MRFKDWIEETAIPITVLAHRLGRSRNWVLDVAGGRATVKPEDAKKIEELTEGKVNRLEILYPNENLIAVEWSHLPKGGQCK